MYKKINIITILLSLTLILVININCYNNNQLDKNHNYKKKQSILNNINCYNNNQLDKNNFTTIDNNILKIKISNIGGLINELQLKNYKAYNIINDKYDQNLFLIKNCSSIHYLINKNFNTRFLIFKPTIINIKNGKKLILITKLNDKIIKFIYTIYNDKYHIDFSINIENFFQKNKNIIFNWNQKIFSLEKEKKIEYNYSKLFYYLNNKLHTLNQEKLINNCYWIANKQQFFTSILKFNKNYNFLLKSIQNKNYKINQYLKEFKTRVFLYKEKNNNDLNFNIRLYFLPLDLKILNSINPQFEKIIPLGLGIIRYLNIYFFAKIFFLLEKTKLNYGIIIILMTTIVKIILFPLFYKQYKTNIIMNLIYPKIKEIQKKFKNIDPTIKNKILLKFYKKLKINPLLSFILILLQIPIFYSLFNFFQTIINLRSQKFLWTNNLTSYDSIYNLQFNIPIYGNHISLFTLLYLIALIVYVKLNNYYLNNKDYDYDNYFIKYNYISYIIYIVMFLLINNYASGLSLYYFISNFINIILLFIINTFLIKKEIIKQKINNFVINDLNKNI
ncbi:MAG: YidC/Oxa1 family insertase periplasmic-domain containing protein [Candidatus Bostrichicola ureolyticus]|nr:MAG: YidC/Oxa1 family insertase periplasmic-domain containing protein [Candidatus Bostrichicola ureolyticus]